MLVGINRSMAAVLIIGWLGSGALAQLIFDDPLTGGTTIGIRDNGQGQFVISEGWKVTSSSDNIRYTPAYAIEDGAVEFDVIGLINDDTVSPDGQLMNMYDASYANPRTQYAPGARLNPFKFVWHRYGLDTDTGPYHTDEFKFIMKVDNVLQYEWYSANGPYNWDPNTTYNFRVQWRDGIVRYYRNGQDSDPWPYVYRGVYHPVTHDIRIATNTRNNAIINAIYSNVKIYDYGTVPTAPYINNPQSTIKTLNPSVDWVGDRHDQYEVHITSGTDPNSGIVRDSGQVTSTNSYHPVTSALANSTTYYAHVRLRNDRGWGSWSQPEQFQTDTGGTIYVPRYGEHEIVLIADADYSNPYLDVTLSATFSGPGQNITVNGFWDGGRMYKMRMLPTVTGTWTWTTSSNKSSLNGKTGSFVCQSSSNKGYVRVSSAYPYTFEWAGDSTPFFLMGDTIWHMYYNLRYADGTFQSLIDDRAAQHFNYAHGVVHDFLHNEGGGIYSEQSEATEEYDCNTLNPDYFKWIDQKIDYMNAKGMIAGLFFAWGNEGYQEYANDDPLYERYERYLVARYASKNVMWVIAGEYDEAGRGNQVWIDYMDEVYDNDPYKHPLTMHATQTTNAFGNVNSHTVIGQQRFGDTETLRQQIANSRVYGKPVINQEYGYEGDPAHHPNNQFPDEVREDHYAIVLAGGYGIYGNNVPAYSTYHRTEDFVLSATDTDGAQYMKILYEFFEQTDFHLFSPSQSLVDNGICAASTNSEYIVQLLTGGSVNVNLSAASGTFYVDWFDPRTGNRSPAGTTTGGVTRSFTAPDSNDWILHIHRDDLSPGAPVAVISANPTSGSPPLTVNFDGTGSYDSDGTIVGYEWDFDSDGNVDSTNAIDSYTYILEDTYLAKLTVTDNEGKKGSLSIQISATFPGVSIDLGATNNTNGISHPSQGDGDTVGASIGGRDCRRNDDIDQDKGFYFNVDDGYAYQGNNQDLYISIEYYDTNDGTDDTFSLHYDAISDQWKNGGSLTLTGSNTWKQHVFHVTDAYFGNRENYGSDFRIWSNAGDFFFYLDTVRVVDTPPGVNPTAVILANPTQGQAPLQVSFDGSNSTDSDGTIISYEWDFDNNGSVDDTGVTVNHTYTSKGTYVAILTVTDSQGLKGTATVQIDVYGDPDFDSDGDVDHEDFGHLQACFSGPNIPQNDSTCLDTRLDGDLDVDTTDFGLFAGCMNGANNPPGC